MQLAEKLDWKGLILSIPRSNASIMYRTSYCVVDIYQASRILEMLHKN
jgi:hypothetical protein